MSVTVAAAAKKIAVYLATDKRTWKVVGTIIGIAIAIVLLPVMLLLAMGNQLSSAETQSIDYSDYVQNLSAQQQSQLSQMESDGTAIADALTKLNLKNQIVKAQMLYLTYFDSVQKGENFFAEYADCCVGSGITKKIFYPKNQPEHKSNRKTRTACVRRHYGKENIVVREHGAPLSGIDICK